MSDLHSRRVFLRAVAAAGVTWAAADLLQVEDALAWSTGQAAAGGPQTFSVLTPEEAAAVDALTSRILPSIDGLPGAHEAGAVYFIDRSLATFNASQTKTYRKGVKDLDRRAARRWKGAARFAGLTTAQQDELLHDIEKTPFFQAARFDAIAGTFALPTWGGNRDHAGWRLIGLTHEPAFQPPFGYYDADTSGKP
jgi:gluconate 2-dehydrogenase gamma chain